MDLDTIADASDPVGFERRVSIAFTVDDDQVIMLRIFYGGRNWEKDLR